MKPSLPVRLGRNQGGYAGEHRDLDAVLTGMIVAAGQAGWREEQLDLGFDPPHSLLYFTRQPARPKARVLLSAGIHGDEPATTEALAHMFVSDLVPSDIEFHVFPCLNPRGMRLGMRETSEGLDMNRDYQLLESEEVRTHIRRLESLPDFDVAVLLHEDWEADGFYLYELTPAQAPPRFGPALLGDVARVFPIEQAVRIDGRRARQGLIHPPFDPDQRLDWPEAFYLMQHKTSHCLTLETASDFPMEARIEAHLTALRSVLHQLTEASE